MNKFQERLRLLRKQEGKSCRVISELCGLSSGAIWKYERGEIQPNIDAVIAIADHFHVSVDYLLGRTNY